MPLKSAPENEVRLHMRVRVGWGNLGLFGRLATVSQGVPGMCVRFTSLHTRARSLCLLSSVGAHFVPEHQPSANMIVLPSANTFYYVGLHCI